MIRVLVSDSMASEGIEVFRKTPGIEVDVITKHTPEELKELVASYDGLVVRSASKITKEILDSADKLTVIGRAGAGVDNIDVEAASKKGIVVMNTPGGNTVTTGEHAIAMMLSLARKIPQATASMKAGKWEKSRFMGNEYCNKTLGIIGIGRIGSVVADRAKGLKMNVIAYDPFISQEAAEKMGITLASLDEIYGSADFISVHTPKNKETTGMINAAAFAKMKKGVFVINCARGGIVNEKDLYDALVSGQVAGAALDVFEEEPTKNIDLISLDNVICTPHLGASTDEAQTTVAVAIAEQMVDYLLKGEIRYAVNFPAVSADLMAAITPYLALAEKLGKFQAQIVSGGIEEINIEYSGEILKYDVAPITIALLKGLLTPILNENVNYINAPVIAKERGINVKESRSSAEGDYRSMITLTLKTSEGESITAGALFGRRDPRIVRINQFTVDVIPEGHLLMLYNHDKPGVIGNIGTAIGSANINIARMHWSRLQAEQKAMVVFSTDTPVDAQLLKKLKETPNVISVQELDM
ncbi:phosphoglycerate dehydrogenase [Syntrophus aciditrophicus]|uniref:D-3-phosphoglycerate dehydrogenase n=1 Tax=Syntrophus aciditrophicus (strain SB) TaxID=56780 RepID=Q2LSJ2_SYNAS|nr:phosphoglycerate dehydrogenase [Syntrophus aciditrophicus]ABC77052.1 D-3-phosphoglycerate dehydrogenase [Syntrophus aciditrophicus SB]OPY15777.1 MAG: D-3-phosphoglycerate dehydrogenase [Syntrophus sp. PtaB.Bin075]